MRCTLVSVAICCVAAWPAASRPRGPLQPDLDKLVRVECAAIAHEHEGGPECQSIERGISQQIEAQVSANFTTRDELDTCMSAVLGSPADPRQKGYVLQRTAECLSALHYRVGRALSQ